MRVIAGTAKGRRLKLVPGDTTRPVMDRVKEAFFSILGRQIFDATFLDLFAGTGSVGIEALSRGAKRAVFVEMDKLAVQTIQANLEITGLGDSATIRRSDVLSFLKKPSGTAYDFIYIAPPQYKDLWKKTLETLDANPGWIGPDTVVIVQIDPSEQQPIELSQLVPYDERRYGKTLLWFFEASDTEATED
ncbi:MAG: 16S rRNA (guanine(966)-N(2))-methyltransferase RsmD [Anaerolineaceae bacterium]|nr:16S rRNA (guanine(966)-N(2))-methyltransferase RsmD [Anaerolineaceae bacterium]